MKKDRKMEEEEKGKKRSSYIVVELDNYTQPLSDRGRIKSITSTTKYKYQQSIVVCVWEAVTLIVTVSRR